MPTTTAKTSTRQEEIVAALRDQIVAGEYRPGDRLPKQADLVRRFHASTVTIQRALEQLADHGLVRSEARKGVFVDDFPPHLVDYCLIFPHPVAKMARSNRFLFSLSQIAEQLSQHGPERTTLYCGLESPSDQQAYHDLVRQVVTHRTAGLIFLTPPTAFADTPIVSTPGIPRVAIMDQPSLPGVTAVRVPGFPERAIEHLADNGCQRLALIGSPTWTEGGLSWFMELARQRGLDLPRHRILAVDPGDPRWAQHAVRLLMQGGPDQAPDGLIISDDNLVPQATAGLLASGVTAPDHCRVVAHANFPWITDCHVPALRVGPDTDQVFRTCIDLIDAGRRGDALPEAVAVEPRVQDDTTPTLEDRR